jgi:hypothetical protein
MKRSVNVILVATLIGGASLVLSAQTASQSQAIRACENELDYRMGSEAQSRVPLATIDRESVEISQNGQNALTLKGKGTYRRDNLDRTRNFTFDCTYTPRTGRATASYKWGSAFSGVRRPELSGDPELPPARPAGRLRLSADRTRVLQRRDPQQGQRQGP